MVLAVPAGSIDIPPLPWSRRLHRLDLVCWTAGKRAYSTWAIPGPEMSQVPDFQNAGEVAKLDFSMDAGSAAGIWAKQFPTELARGTVDTITVRAKTAEPLSRVRAKLELKGSAGVETIPVELAVDWTSGPAASRPGADRHAVPGCLSG